MLNLTPHAISLTDAGGNTVTIQPSGIIARVTSKEVIVDTVAGIPVIKRTFGEVENLPEEGTQCIVSSLVLSACAGRKGVYAPDTGPSAVRKDGQVVAVTRLVAA